jgi:hypothetical protein
MSRRRTNSNSVSLFPFLAVLLCAMGALLFLLLVATRMIRDEAVQKHTDRSAWEHAASPPRLLTELDPGTPRHVPAEEIVLGPPQSFPNPPRREPPPPTIIVHEPEPLPDLSAPIARLREEIRSLEDERVALQRKARERESLEARTREIEAEIEAQTEALRREESAIERTRRQLQERDQEVARARPRLAELEQSLRELNEQIRLQSSQPRTAENPIKIVPYDGAGGTTRRPLILECREEAIVFQPEGRKITEQDLRGFTTLNNPVLSGVRALDSFWTAHDKQRGNSTQPYVLIVVRPDGIPAYYALRKLLEEYDQPFGYELLADEQPLSLDPVNPEALQALNQTIEQSLAQRGSFVTGKGAIFLSPDRSDNGLEANQNAKPDARTNAPAESPTGASAGRPMFRQTPRGIEFLPSGESPKDSIIPVTPLGSKNSPASGSQSGPLAIPRSGRPAGAIEAGGAPSSRNVEANSSSLTQSSKPAAASGDPAAETDPFKQFEPFEPEPHGERRDTEVSQELLPSTNPLLSGSRSGGTAASTRSEGQPGRPTISDGKIRFQRELTVRLGMREFRVGHGKPVPLPEGISSRELLSLIVEELRSETSSWGAPPEHLSWKPVVRFVLQPGGFQHYERIRPYFERHKLIDSVSFDLNGEPNQTPNPQARPRPQPNR